MRDSFFKMFGSVRLVQEVSRSASSSPSSSPATVPAELPQVGLSHHPHMTETPLNVDSIAAAAATTTVNDNNNGNDNDDTLNETPMQRSRTVTTAAITTTPLIAATSTSTTMHQQQNQNQQPGYPVSLASYLPGMPLYVPSYANPSRTLSSWMVGMPSSNTSLNARPKRKHARKNSLYSVRHHRPKQPSFSSPSSAGQIHHHQQQQHVSLNAFASPSPIITTPSTLPSSQPQPQSKSTPLLTFSSSTDTTGRGAAAAAADDQGDSNEALLLLLNDKFKPKSQKLLCLWPLPVITRYIIGISLIVSTLNFLGFFHLKCSSPSFVIHRLEIANLLLSPFLFTGSLHTFFLFAWNILILGLFEESLAHMLGGTRRFVKVLVGIILSVCMIRQGIGYVFSKSTGFAVPTLFFSDSLHECNQGLAPFLFALLIVQSLSIDDKYFLMYGPEDSNQKITVRKVALQLLMCLVNYTVKNILWWSLTGLLTGYIMTIVIQTCLARERTWFDERQEEKDEEDKQEKQQQRSFLVGHQQQQLGREKEKTTTTTDEPFVYHRRMPFWRVLLSAVKKGAIVVMITLPVLLMCNAYYTRETFVDPTVLNQVTHDRYMFTFVVMTAPRRGDPAFLSRTLESYLANWPVDPAPGSLYDRIQGLVYTHFTNHTQYDVAKDRFSNDLKGQRYLKWVREDGDMFDQRLHVSKALSLAADNYQSTYIALLEDDFPVCGGNEWRQIENVVYAANQRVPGHCGVFVGTGGSGLFMKPKIAKLVSGLLLKYTETPPDIVLQQCLAGDLPECSECSQTLVTSKTLLMYHIGFNTSTSHDRTYKKHDFQCGWRHPFNGDPSVITL